MKIIERKTNDLTANVIPFIYAEFINPEINSTVIKYPNKKYKLLGNRLKSIVKPNLFTYLKVSQAKITNVNIGLIISLTSLVKIKNANRVSGIKTSSERV
jgi:hypothetical protein